VTEYRTPDEDRHQAEQVTRIRAVLDQAIHDGAFCKTAMCLDEPQDVVELWTNRIWNRLRNELSDEDRLQAIIVLLDEQITREAKGTLLTVGGEL
jgi:hypothetical protein